ncbi:hypothetical protein Taro_055366, partial [Colocasia esculenta]|nr:hypothetical protein [Colocasia esculenta]
MPGRSTAKALLGTPVRFVDQTVLPMPSSTAMLPSSVTVRNPAGSLSGVSLLATHTTVLSGRRLYHTPTYCRLAAASEFLAMKKPSAKIWSADTIVWFTDMDCPGASLSPAAQNDSRWEDDRKTIKAEMRKEEPISSPLLLSAERVGMVIEALPDVVAAITMPEDEFVDQTVLPMPSSTAMLPSSVIVRTPAGSRSGVSLLATHTTVLIPGRRLYHIPAYSRVAAASEFSGVKKPRAKIWPADTIVWFADMDCPAANLSPAAQNDTWWEDEKRTIKAGTRKEEPMPLLLL